MAKSITYSQDGLEDKIEIDWQGASLSDFIASTNGFHGGDAGHGGFVKIQMRVSAGWKIILEDENVGGQFLTIHARGDDEMAALAFLIENLNQLLKNKGVSYGSHK
jgi:hypothetical protein